MACSSGFHVQFSSLRINIKGYSGTAGKISSLGTPGSDFSTKDTDNDKCVCKCSQLTTGGKRTALCINKTVLIKNTKCVEKHKDEYIHIYNSKHFRARYIHRPNPPKKVEVTRAQLAQNAISDDCSGDLRIHDS